MKYLCLINTDKLQPFRSRILAHFLSNQLDSAIRRLIPFQAPYDDNLVQNLLNFSIHIDVAQAFLK